MSFTGSRLRLNVAYRGSHARSTHHVVVQTVEVSPEQAQLAYQLVTRNGRVAGAFCSNATSSVLAQIPGFESIETTFYPGKLSEQFAALPGVSTQVYRENDSRGPERRVGKEQCAFECRRWQLTVPARRGMMVRCLK